MSSSLIPERPLLISPTLAATIGLEEAVMLHVLSELMLRQEGFLRQERRWCELSSDGLAAAMPFWSVQDIRRVQRNLQEKGLILVEPVSGNPQSQLVAINQRETADASPRACTAPPLPQGTRTGPFAPPRGGKASYIPPNWEPAEELYQQCLHHGIPRPFVEQRVKSFVMYQRERQKTQYSWHNAFLNYILREWRKEQSYQGAKELESDMSPDWRPSGEAVSILEHAGVSQAFVEDAVPEFVLYWRERGLVTSTWNTRFIQHVRRQWESFKAALEHDRTPRPIPADYEPSATCLEVLELANIDLDFARSLVKEFVLYWQDRGEIGVSWNTRFLQYVKSRWANRQNLPASRGIEGTLERFTDRSWAE